MNFKTRTNRVRGLILFAGVLALLVWILFGTNAQQFRELPPNPVTPLLKSCVELIPTKGPYPEAVVTLPGMYCVTADLWQQRLSGAGHSGPGFWRRLIEVGADNVTIDLRYHTLHSDGDSSGIVVTAARLFGQTTHKATNITIKNGVIDLRGLGAGVASLHHWNMYEIQEKIPKALTGYEKSSLVLANMLIKTGSDGVVFEGDGIIIRNSIIDSRGNAAIMIAGPNAKLINNTIILRNPIIPSALSNSIRGSFEPRHFAEFLEQRKKPRVQ